MKKVVLMVLVLCIVAWGISLELQIKKLNSELNKNILIIEKTFSLVSFLHPEILDVMENDRK